MSEPSRSRPALPWQAIVAATVLALTAAGLVLVFASSGDGSADDAADRVPIPLEADEGPAGDPLDAEFTEPDGDAGTIRSSMDGRPMVVNFFGSWCIPCVKEMPDFQTVAQELDGRVDFLGLAVNDRPEDAAEIIEQTGVTYPWARDAEGNVVRDARIPQYPATMFVSEDGELVDIRPGAVDADELRALIAEHLGVEVPA